jgi:hypothetical protein
MIDRNNPVDSLKETVVEDRSFAHLLNELTELTFRPVEPGSTDTLIDIRMIDALKPTSIIR